MDENLGMCKNFSEAVTISNAIVYRYRWIIPSIIECQEGFIINVYTSNKILLDSIRDFTNVAMNNICERNN